MKPVHTITLQGGPYHAETRPVPEPPQFEASLAGVNKYPPTWYYAFGKYGDRWKATAIYIQDPYERDLFHYFADAEPRVRT
jgi:hypothetical protein